MPIIDEWADFLRASGHAPSTIRLYSVVVTAMAKQAGAQPELVTRTDVVRFLARDDVTRWTKATYWKAIASWSKYLIEFGHRSDSLTKGLARPRNPDPVARPISDEEVRQLLRANLTPRANAYVRLALYAGLRAHEIAKLKAEDFDLAAGWLMVTGKGGRTAPIPIHPEVLRIASTMAEYGYWFPSPRDPARPVEPKAVSETIRNALRSIGSTATGHQLRDTAATRMQRAVKDIRVTQAMLRHRSLQSTMKYTKVASEDMQAAVLALSWPRDAA